MRIICDGHEYRVIEHADALVALNNYGRPVAEAIISPCGEYWIFEHGEHAISSQYHVNELAGYSVREQLVRWYAAQD